MIRPSRWLTILSLLILAGCNASSGYHWSSVYRQDIKTVAVPVFTNVDFAQGDELKLTRAVITQIEQRTPYKVVDRAKADTILEGQITKVSVTNISSDRNSGLPQEQLYNVRVNFVWKDLRTGKVLVERRGFEQQSPYYPTLGEGRPTGSLDATEQLGTAIVQELQGDW